MVGIAALALGLRVAYLNHGIVDRPLRADAGQYVAYGYNLALRGAFSRSPPSEEPVPDSYRSPGYPALIAVAFLTGGEENWHRVLYYGQAVLGMMLVIVTFLVGRMFLSFGWALVPAAFVALSPHLVAMGGYILTENLFSVALTASVGLFCLALRRASDPLFAITGLSFGFAYLVNPTTLLLPLLLALVVVRELRRREAGPRKAQSTMARGLSLCVVLAFLVAGSWSVRNRLVVPPEGATGKQRALSTLTHGTYPGFVYESEAYKYYPYHEDPEQPEYGQSLSAFLRIFGRRVMQRPLRYLSWYLLEKPYYVWSWSILQGQGDIYVYPVRQSLYMTSAAADGTRRFMKWMHPVVLLFALVGCVWEVGRPGKARESGRAWEPRVVMTTLVYFTGVYALFVPWPRYGIPLRPLLYLLAVWAAVQTLAFIRLRWPRPRVAGE